MSKNIYIVGIEGAGTSALAQILVARGARVSGSDDGDGFYRDNLRKIGVEVYDNFDIANIGDDIDLAIHSTAFDSSNVEIAELIRRGVRMLSYPEAVAEIFNCAQTPIAVCGTHGKTTTTAMIGEVLRVAGAEPTVLVGSQIVGWNGNALTGDDKIMVLEADEYQNKLRYYNPKIVVLTSVEYDHPDFYPTPESYQQAFIEFIVRIPVDGLLVVYGDDLDLLDMVKKAQPKCRVIRYGFDGGNIIIKNYASDIVDDMSITKFNIDNQAFVIGLPGKHNVLNTTAAIAVARHLGYCDADIGVGLAKFRGAKRRFESHGAYNGAVLIDDYAHHPTEVQATLRAARDLYPGKNIIAAFHPHTFTRTKALLSDFAQSFWDVNQVVVIDVYGSAREEQGGVSSQDLVDAINKQASIWNIATNNEKRKALAQYTPTIQNLADWARANLRKDDVFITLGAGDIWKVHDLIKRCK